MKSHSGLRLTKKNFNIAPFLVSPTRCSLALNIIFLPIGRTVFQDSPSSTFARSEEEAEKTVALRYVPDFSGGMSKYMGPQVPQVSGPIDRGGSAA